MEMALINLPMNAGNGFYRESIYFLIEVVIPETISTESINIVMSSFVSFSISNTNL